MRRRLYGLFCILTFAGIFMDAAIAQKQQPSVDEGYTVARTLRKISKEFPQATPVEIDEQERQFIEEPDQVYTSIGERKLHMDVYIPSNQKSDKYPAIVLIHGRGWASGNRSLLTPMARALAGKGYATFNLEYRLAGEAKYPAAVLDVKMAVKYIKENSERYEVDTSQIALLGCSAGAQLATLVGTTPEIEKFSIEGIARIDFEVQAIVNVDGIVAFIHPESAEGKAAGNWLGGTKEEIPETWYEASPITYAGSDTPPVLFLNSSIARFHAGRDDFIKVLDREGIYSEIHPFPNSPHSFWLFHPWFEPTIDSIDKFLKRVFQ